MYRVARLRQRIHGQSPAGRILNITGLATLLALTIAGCAGNGGSFAIVGSDPKIVVSQATSSQLRDWFIPDMGYGGQLAYDPETGCLYLGRSELEAQYLRLVWPRGTRPIADAGHSGVEIPIGVVEVVGLGRDTHPPLPEPYTVWLGERLLLGGTLLDDAYFAKLRSGELPEEVVALFGWVEGAMEVSGCGGKGNVLVIRDVAKETGV